MKKTFYESERDNKNKVIHILLYNTECKMHFHNATEILFVKKGRVHYSCLSDNDILHPGEAVFLPAFFSHRFHSEEETETETLMIPYKYLHNFKPLPRGVVLPENIDSDTDVAPETVPESRNSQEQGAAAVRTASGQTPKQDSNSSPAAPQGTAGELEKTINDILDQNM